jgi:hypothetical protein
MNRLKNWILFSKRGAPYDEPEELQVDDVPSALLFGNCGWAMGNTEVVIDLKSSMNDSQISWKRLRLCVVFRIGGMRFPNFQNECNSGNLKHLMKLQIWPGGCDGKNYHGKSRQLVGMGMGVNGGWEKGGKLTSTKALANQS